MKWIKLAASAGTLVLLIWLLQTRFGKIPPLGKFLNPVTGFWANAEPRHVSGHRDLHLKGVTGEVKVRYDRQGIPHIFANNEHDLYFTQGYVTAKDRLWQMDIQVRTASGRLSEIMGRAGLEKDLYYRRLGVPYAAERTLALMWKDPLLRNIIESYTAGVNAYISELTPAQYPIEFKLLDYAPEPYQPVNCALVLKLLSETLSGGSDDVAMTRTLQQLGANTTAALFPDKPYHEDPVIPAGTPWNFEPVKLAPPNREAFARTGENLEAKATVDGIGSNNWAVAGNRTDNGFPILANDPHLTLTFPSIWYQLQLASGDMNTYGVSIPGTPCIIIGYNHSVGWGVTNVQADAMDWYQLQFKDASRSEYWYQGHWNPVRMKVEKIGVRGGGVLYDTVRYTHQGPVRFAQSDVKGAPPIGYAVRWIAAEPSEEIKAFYLLNRSRNYDDYRNALRYYAAPAQNFIFASSTNDIAITSQGRFPLRYQDQGKFVLDGRDSTDDWHGWIPNEQNPTVKNPARGFVSSANQPLTDASYPYYISWQFGSSERARRINDRLGTMNHVSIDSLRLLQNDNYSVVAADALDSLLSFVDVRKLKPAEAAQWKALRDWDRNFDAKSVSATLFSLWWSALYKAVWEDDFPDEGKEVKLPSRDRTLDMILHEKNAPWFDNKRTPQKETCSEQVNAAFHAAVAQLSEQYGPSEKGREWGRAKSASIAHLGGVAAFGSGRFISSGSASCVNAMSKNFGPSWRMIVQFGPNVKGYGIYPGGQSGNPGSPYYDNFFLSWKEGKLLEFVFLDTDTDHQDAIQSTLTIKK